MLRAMIALQVRAECVPHLRLLSTSALRAAAFKGPGKEARAVAKAGVSTAQVKRVFLATPATGLQSAVDSLLTPAGLAAMDLFVLCHLLRHAGRADGVKLPWGCIASQICTKKTSLFNARSVASLLYELRDRSSDHADTRAFLAALTPKVAGCTNAFNAQDVGNALYGLQGCSD